jgi:hypothetical protein
VIVSISQPAYLPWLGYLQRIARSDLHVVLDHVQFEKGSFTNRNRIRTKEDAVWLTVPLATKGRFGELAINTLQFAPNPTWQKDHWATLQRNYARAPSFKQYAAGYEALYSRSWDGFSALLRAMLEQQLRDFGILTPLRFSSEMNPAGVKGDLIFDLCRRTGATTYLSGPFGRDYLDEAVFQAAGIAVEYHDFDHPTYAQAWPGFVSHLSALDLLFNHGPASHDILTKQPALAA